MPLYCLIFQDDIAKMNANMHQARERARYIGKMSEKYLGDWIIGEGTYQKPEEEEKEAGLKPLISQSSNFL